MLSNLHRIHKASIPYIFLSPTLVVIALVYGYPIVQLFFLSTRKVIAYDNTINVGLTNFKILITDPVFRLAILNNVRLLFGIPILIALSVFFAALLRDSPPGWKIYRAIVFLPYVLAIPVIGVAFSHILRLNGPLNVMLRDIGLGFLALDWIGNPKSAPWVLLIVIVWKELGFGVILFLARLLSTSENLYEAAMLDGANWWQRLWNVSVPELRSVISSYAILMGITLFSWVFAYVYTMTGGGPGNSTSVLEFYIYKKAFMGGKQFGVAAAVSVVLFAGVFIVIFLQSILSRREK
jgi:ABC-type sugar transport system permease subunit